MKSYTTQEALTMARGLGLPTDDQSVDQLRVGMQVEREHDDVTGGHAAGVAKIAAAHLREDSLYYVPLVALERFREGDPVYPKVQVRSAPGFAGEQVIVLGVEGLDPMVADTVPEQDGDAIVRFLRTKPALAVVYAWMTMKRAK